MKNIPCKDCICFAVCNSKVHKLNGVYKTQFIINEVKDCSLFTDWLNQYQQPYNYRISKTQLKIFCDCFNVKYDIFPEYDLLRHLERYTINGIYESKYKRT